MTGHGTPQPTELPRRIRTLRQASGLTVATCAHSAGVHANTWMGWERGRAQPRPRNVDAIARALGVAVAALLVPDGWRAWELRLEPATVDRIRRGGAVEAARVAEQVAAQLPAILLAVATQPDRPPNPEGRSKRRRTRAQVLAGIEQANAMRTARADRRRATAEDGGRQGAQRDVTGGLPGSDAYLGHVEPVSTLGAIETDGGV